MVPFQWPWMTPNSRFQGHEIIQCQITRKWYEIEPYLQRQTKVSGTWSTEWYNFQRPWTTRNPNLKVTPLFDAKYIRNSPRYRHSYNGILIGTYTCPTQGCHFQYDVLLLTTPRRWAALYAGPNLRLESPSRHYQRVLTGFVTGIHKDSVRRWNVWFPSTGVFAEVLAGKGRGRRLPPPVVSNDLEWPWVT